MKYRARMNNEMATKIIWNNICSKVGASKLDAVFRNISAQLPEGVAPVPRGNLQRIKDGKSPTLGTICGIAAALEVEPWSLLMPNLGAKQEKAKESQLAFADLTPYEAGVITALRQPPRFSVQELTQITESLSAALSLKRAGENADHEVQPIGVYFAVERRTHNGEPSEERRGGTNWVPEKTNAETEPQPSTRRAESRPQK